MQNKKNGIYYTPPVLAEYLAKPLLTNKYDTVFDPAYGEGSLLLAAEKIFKEKNNESQIHLFGCDTKPVNGLLNHLPAANLIKLDFFDFSIENKFQTILMNPPYVRHHIQSEKKISKYRATHKELNILNNAADLWALFLVKAISHLNKGGGLGAILPWAFLQADYATPLRKLLSDNFRDVRVVAFSNKYFEKADERIVVLWSQGYGLENETIKCAVSKQINDEIEFTELPLSNWVSDRVSYFAGNNIDELLSKFKSEYGFKKFSEYAYVKIGVVTGAVKHFILSKEQASEFGISNSRLVPILTESDDFQNYLMNGKKKLKFLVALKDGDHLRYRKFNQSAIKEEYHLRAHSKRRKPWYVIPQGDIPDAFFQYRITKIPFLLPNPLNVQSTNAIHRVYFKKLTTTEKKWIYVSMLSAPSQLSIETNSKTYGRGILKIEPKSLKNSLVLRRSDRSINPVYNEVMDLLSQNKKLEAMNKANDFMNQELGISKELLFSATNILQQIYALRRETK